jgi:hypothetical protein
MYKLNNRSLHKPFKNRPKEVFKNILNKMECNRICNMQLKQCWEEISSMKWLNGRGKRAQINPLSFNINKLEKNKLNSKQIEENIDG